MIRKHREKTAKNLGVLISLEDYSLLDILFIVASNVKYVKFRLQNMLGREISV